MLSYMIISQNCSFTFFTKAVSVTAIKIFVTVLCLLTEPTHDKSNKMTCAPSKDSDQPGHPSSQIRVFAGPTGNFVGFVMWQLN